MRTRFAWVAATASALVLGLLSMVPDAGASETVECRSRDYQRNECQTPFREVRLVRQLSRAPCDEGRTWGSRRGRIWVSDGCAGEFADGRGGPPAPPAQGGGGHTGGGWPGAEVELECRSRRNAYTRCNAPSRPTVLVRQLSRAPCTEGSSWGVDAQGLWVDAGCAGLFRQGSGHPDAPPPLSGPQYLACTSIRGRPATCRFPVPARQAVLHQQDGDAPCEEGLNWDWDERSLRVRDGCGGLFRYWPR
ncbi:MAG: DUF3011 domain-containing protein [Xanthomonadales bacterium]|nr:DUF3011 domain-containing protein [Xanthomonadales bacterium]